jgi:hypothetical protein
VPDTLAALWPKANSKAAIIENKTTDNKSLRLSSLV